MGRGDGRLFLRGNTFWCDYSLRGKRYRESCDTSDEKEAIKFLKARLREVGADLIGARTFTTPKASRLTIHELCEALKADFELRAKATAQNLSHLRRVDSDFGQYRAIELTAEKIDKYVEGRLAEKQGANGERIEGDRPASVNRTLQLLSQSYTLAIRRGHLSCAPYIRHLSEAGNARSGFLGESQLAVLVSHLPADLQDFTRFGFLTGWRKGEIASLAWSDLDGDTIRLRGENSKSGESRVVPLVGELAKLIERRKAARRMESRFIFHRDGAPVAEFRKAWATATSNAGLAGTLFHDLRRSACRRMMRAGVPQAVCQKISGHKTASMFHRYAIVAESDLAQALEQTDKFRETDKAKVVAMR
jgi:integrase